MDNTNIHIKNRVYVLLDEMRTSIISMDLSYSQTSELLDQILEIEKAVDSMRQLLPIKLEDSESNE